MNPKTNERERVAKAVTELREAIQAAPAERTWFEEIAAGRALDVARASLERWATDLGEILASVSDGLSQAPETVPGDTNNAVLAADKLASALVQLGAALDRIYAITAQALGVRHLVPWRQGVRFNPDKKSVRGAINTLAQDSAAAAGLKRQLDLLQDHAAIDLRNEIVHAMQRPFPELTETCWIRRTYLDDRGGIIGTDMGPLYPARSLDLNDALPQTLWEAARTVCVEALELLLEATAMLAGLLREGELAAPQTVYITHDGSLLMERP